MSTQPSLSELLQRQMDAKKANADAAKQAADHEAKAAQFRALSKKDLNLEAKIIGARKREKTEGIFAAIGRWKFGLVETTFDKYGWQPMPATPGSFSFPSKKYVATITGEQFTILYQEEVKVPLTHITKLDETLAKITPIGSVKKEKTPPPVTQPDVIDKLAAMGAALSAQPRKVYGVPKPGMEIKKAEPAKQAQPPVENEFMAKLERMKAESHKPKVAVQVTRIKDILKRLD